MNIPAVHLYPFRVVNITAAADLPHAGDSRPYHIVFLDIFSIAGNFFLHDGTGPDETHFPLQHIQELRQLIQTRFPQKGTGSGDAGVIFQLERRFSLFPCFRIGFQQFLQPFRRVNAHAAEFIAVKFLAVFSYAAVFIDHRSGRIPIHPESYPQ